MCTVGSPIRLVTAESVRAEAIFTAKEINRLIGGIDMLDAQEKRVYPVFQILQCFTVHTVRRHFWRHA